MADLMTVMGGEGISSGELEDQEIFAEFHGDVPRGEDRTFDPFKRYVPIDQIADPRPSPLDCLIAGEEADIETLRGGFALLQPVRGKSGKGTRREFNRLARLEESLADA